MDTEEEIQFTESLKRLKNFMEGKPVIEFKTEKEWLESPERAKVLRELKSKKKLR